MKNKQNVFRAYFIGDDFYSKSGTMMSSIYTEDGFRTDWGKVQIALREGMSVEIRQATDAEMLKAYKQLNEYQARQSAYRP